jgi:hypothetical protein
MLLIAEDYDRLVKAADATRAVHAEPVATKVRAALSQDDKATHAICSILYS